MKKESVTSAQVVLRSIQKQSKPVLNKLARIENISDIETLDQAGVMLKALKEMSKEADRQEKTITDPLTKALQATRELFKPFKEMVKEEDERVKSLILAYHENQEKKVKKLESDFTSGKIKKATTFIEKQTELKVSSHSSSVRKLWKAVPINIEKTPRAFMVPDEAKILQALKDGEKIPGWELQQVKSIAV